MAKATLWIVGVPLREDGELSAPAKAAIHGSDLVIGESRKPSFRTLAQVPGAKTKPLFLLDESARPEEKLWPAAVQELARRGGSLVLFSDTGMPLLFDPGRDVLAQCRKLGFEIRSVSSATSWGSAAALSGWEPPFYIAGFPPREPAPRRQFWETCRQTSAHMVLMERPYRFLALLAECREVFGRTRPAFLAWELELPAERLLWGTIEELEKFAKQFEKTKGEFVLVIRGPSSARKENFS